MNDESNPNEAKVGTQGLYMDKLLCHAGITRVPQQRPSSHSHYPIEVSPHGRDQTC